MPLFKKPSLHCALTGKSLLSTSHFNKGSAFSADERTAFDLHGLLPSAVHTLDQQIERAYAQYSVRTDNMAKNTFLASLKDQNEVLFYKLVSTHLKEMMAIVYTPTEGAAIERYSEIFRRPDGCFLEIGAVEKVEAVLSGWGGEEEVDYIVVTDGEEILGIGDQGVGGVLISTAKLVLMTLCAGLYPNRTIPVVLDCGTDNPKLLNDPLYLGLRHPRIRGKQYDHFVDTVVQSVKKLFPRAVLHFEDFGLINAHRLLLQYRPQLPCFNDDVQGTGVITLAAIQAGAKVAGLELKDLRMVIFGAGSAGAGIADHFRDAVAVSASIPAKEAAKQIWLVDKPGLLLQSSELTEAQEPYARADSESKGVDASSLESIIAHVKPHVLVGCSTKPGAFTESIVREMAKHVDRPLIFPLSNPTRLHEATPEDLFAWTDGKALVATGSPFPQVEHKGKKYDIAECNNALAFPGIGLGAVLSRASKISDGMLVAAVEALAVLSPMLKDETKGLLPDVEDVRSVSKRVAVAVVAKAVEEGLSRVEGIPEEEAEREEWVASQMWDAEYRSLVRVGKEGAGREERGELGIGRSR